MAVINWRCQFYTFFRRFVIFNLMIVAPLTDNESERLRDLFKYNILDTPEEQDFNDIVCLASQICGTSISLISLIDKDRQWFKVKVGLRVDETHRNLDFCAHTIQSDELMMVKNALQDERFHDNPLVTGEPNIRFYAGMPLVTPAGHKLGTLCVIDKEPRTLSEDQKFALQILSRQVVKQLELRVVNNHLSNTLHQAQAAGKLGIYEVDLQTHVWNCSKAFYQLYGWNEKKAFTTDDFKAAVHPEDSPAVMQYLVHCLEHEDRFNIEYRSFRWDTREVFFVRSMSQVIRNEKGEPTKVIGIKQNVTEKALAEIQLKNQNEILKKTNTELDNFVYRVSHDLRSPISSALGLVDLIGQENTNATVSKLLKLVEECLHKQDHIIHNILDYSRNARMHIKAEAIDFEHFIREILTSYNHELESKEIEVSLDIHQKGTFYTDPSRLTVVLNNLISNVIRYVRPHTSPPFLKISVSASKRKRRSW